MRALRKKVIFLLSVANVLIISLKGMEQIEQIEQIEHSDLSSEEVRFKSDDFETADLKSGSKRSEVSFPSCSGEFLSLHQIIDQQSLLASEDTPKSRSFDSSLVWVKNISTQSITVYYASKNSLGAQTVYSKELQAGQFCKIGESAFLEGLCYQVSEESCCFCINLLCCCENPIFPISIQSALKKGCDILFILDESYFGGWKEEICYLQFGEAPQKTVPHSHDNLLAYRGMV